MISRRGQRPGLRGDVARQIGVGQGQAAHKFQQLGAGEQVSPRGTDHRHQLTVPLDFDRLAPGDPRKQGRKDAACFGGRNPHWQTASEKSD